MTVKLKRLVAGSQIAASATTYYTATNLTARIDACTLTNTTGGAVTVTMHLVPSGGTADATNIILSAHPVPAGGSYIVPGALGQAIESGGTLQALASAATSVTIVVSGIEYT